MVLGLIGILAVTMLSLNNFSANDEKLSLTKLAQADDAVHANDGPGLRKRNRAEAER